MTDLAARRKSIEAEGVKIALVHMGTPEPFAKFAEGYGLADIPAVSDPERRLYRGLGLRRGKLRQIFGWSVLTRGARAFFSGHGAGTLQGDGMQLPGVFVIRDGHVVRRFLHTTSADRPDYVEFGQLPSSPNS